MATYILHTKGDALCRDFYDLSTPAMAHAMSLLRPIMEAQGITEVYPSACNDFAIDNKIMFTVDGTILQYRDNADWSEVYYLQPCFDWEDADDNNHEVRTFFDLSTEEDAVWAVRYMQEEQMLPKAWDDMDAYDIYRAFSAQVREIAADFDLLFTNFGVGYHREDCRMAYRFPLDSI